jgi:hypothetical protein
MSAEANDYLLVFEEIDAFVLTCALLRWKSVIHVAQICTGTVLMSKMSLSLPTRTAGKTAALQQISAFSQSQWAAQAPWGSLSTSSGWWARS